MRIILKIKLSNRFWYIKDLKKFMLVSIIVLIVLISKILIVILGILYKIGFKNIVGNWKNCKFKFLI